MYHPWGYHHKKLTRWQRIKRWLLSSWLVSFLTENHYHGDGLDGGISFPPTRTLKTGNLALIIAIIALIIVIFYGN